MDRFRRAICVLIAAISTVFLMIAAAPTDAADSGNRARELDHVPIRISLRDAVATAITRNLRIAESRLAVQKKEHQRRSAFSNFFPSLYVQYVATSDRYRQSSDGPQQKNNVEAFARSHDSRWYYRGYPNPDQTTGLYPDYPYRIDPYRTFTVVGTLSQPFYSGGKLINNYKYARLGVDLSEIQFEVDKQDLTLEVYEAYYHVMQSQKLLDVAIQSILALEALKNQAVEFFRAGMVPKVDMLSTEGQLAQARIQKNDSLTDIDKYKAQLNYLLRYPQETPTEIVHDYKYQPSGYRIPDIYSVAAANRSEIRQANISVEQALALMKASQADLVPSVQLQIQGSRTNDDWNPLDREAINDWQVRGILTWAFDMCRRRETVKERRVGQARSSTSRELLIEQIMEEVKEAYLDMKHSEANIFDNQAAVEYRKENFRINRLRYKEQMATYIEVLDAQRQLYQAEGDYYTSLVQYRINRAVLERSMGIIQ